jgi:hypothetical protein
MDTKRTRLRLARSTRRFWFVFAVTLFVCASASALRGWQTRHAPELDGRVEIGWPYPFLTQGGFGGSLAYQQDARAFAEDLLVWFIAATSASYVLKDGVRRWIRAIQ